MTHRKSPRAKNLQPFKFSDVDPLVLAEPKILYVLCGQGLGDVIFGNRLLLLLRQRLKTWKIIVFLSREWADISVVDDLDLTVVWYPLITEYPDRYKWGQEYIIDNSLENNETVFFIRWDSLALPDRYSRFETVFESTCRGIGLSIEEKDCRGYVPYSEKASDQAERVLEKLGLSPSDYYVLGPHTGSHKNWGIQNYEELGRKLYSEYGLKCIIVGVDKDPIPQIPESFSLLSYPLDIVSEVISRSAFFVGNDSGITHMAGCSDIPVYEIFAKARLEPLIEWRTLSPFARYILEPFLDDSNQISVDTVFYLIRMDLEFFKKNKKIEQVVCLACQRRMVYTIRADDCSVCYLCFCGGGFQFNKANEEPSSFSQSIELFKQSGTLPSSPLDIVNLKSYIENTQERKYEVVLTISNPYKPPTFSDAPLSPVFFWSIDATFLFFKELGYFPEKISEFWVDNKSFQKISFTRDISRKHLMIPWGGGNGYCQTIELYFKYFCWNAFATYFRAGKIPQSILNYEHKKNLMITASLFVFTAFKGRKSGVMFLKNIFRYFKM